LFGEASSVLMEEKKYNIKFEVFFCREQVKEDSCGLLHGIRSIYRKRELIGTVIFLIGTL
jgi:hypothetical protein